ARLVFPEPTGPTTAQVSPSRIVQFRSRKTTAPPGRTTVALSRNTRRSRPDSGRAGGRPLIRLLRDREAMAGRWGDGRSAGRGGTASVGGGLQLLGVEQGQAA